MPTHLIKNGSLFALALLLAACARPTEEQALAKMRNGLVYSEYRLLSEKGFALGLAAYIKSADMAGKLDARLKPMKHDLTPDEVCMARLMMAYSALLAEKHTIGLVETDIVSASQCDNFAKAGASSLRSVIFQREQWPRLAAQESRQSVQLLPASAAGIQAEGQLIVFHLALAVGAFQDQHFDRMQVHIDALGLLFQQPWISRASAATLKFRDGNYTDGLRDIKRISEDNSTPPQIRQTLTQFIGELEAKTGNVDATGFMLRLMAAALWDMAKQRASDGMSAAAGYADAQLKISGKIDSAKGAWDETLKKARDALPGK